MTTLFLVTIFVELHLGNFWCSSVLQTEVLKRKANRIFRNILKLNSEPCGFRQFLRKILEFWRQLHNITLLDLLCSPYLIWFFLIQQSFLSWLLQVNRRNALENIMKFRKFLTLQQDDFNYCQKTKIDFETKIKPK